MNVPVIVGLLLTLFSAIVLLAGFFSGNMYWNNGALGPELDTGRATAPGCFWTAASAWMLLAILGTVIVIMSWGK